MIGSKLSLLAVLAVALCATAAVSAQADLKIGVINVARLIEQAPQSSAVTKKLEEEFGPRQRDIMAMRQRLQTQSETFQRDAPVLAENERLNLERQIRDGQRELQRTENEYLEDLNLRRNEELGILQREVLVKAQEYARAQQFDLVLADANVIFASTAVDITEAVLGLLAPGGAGAGAGAGASTPPPAAERDRRNR
jgi:outer membrane protein